MKGDGKDKRQFEKTNNMETNRKSVAHQLHFERPKSVQSY